MAVAAAVVVVAVAAVAVVAGAAGAVVAVAAVAADYCCYCQPLFARGLFLPGLCHAYSYCLYFDLYYDHPSFPDCYYRF